MRLFCDNLALSIDVSSFGSYKLRRMVLYFKPDKDNIPIFLYAGSVRLEIIKVYKNYSYLEWLIRKKNKTRAISYRRFGI